MWNYKFKVPESKKVRMIVHTDCKNEADDQFALAHHLMTPKFEVKGIIAGHFVLMEKYRDLGGKTTVDASYDEIVKVLGLMGLEGQYPIAKGSPKAMSDLTTAMYSEGADMIIEEAMKDDPMPLYVAFQGSITDLALAYLKEPRIADRLTAIWIGGGSYPNGGREFNLMQDINAANVVFSSNIPLWQVPIDTYKQMAVSIAELQYRVSDCGEIGKYLFEQLVEFNEAYDRIPQWPHGEIWGLGDSPTISVLLEELERTTSYEVRPAPNVDADMNYIYGEKANRDIRVYTYVDSRLTMEDFYAKLHINFGQK